LDLPENRFADKSVECAAPPPYGRGMSSDLRELDLADEQQLREFHEVIRRAEREDGRDWNRVWTYDEMLSALREPDETERVETCAAYLDGRLVGAAVHYFFLLENLHKTWLEVYVDPAERRRGVGSKLVEWGVERARAEGRTQVTSESSYAFELRESAPALLFAGKHGFRVANTEIHRKLMVPPADGLLDEIEADAAAHTEGFSFEHFVGRVPDALIASYCALTNKLAVEAPGGEFDWEEESVTPEILRETERKMAAIGRDRWTTVALRDGQVVALTDMVVTKGEHRASQWSTIVDRDFRGHRLGAAVKVANLRQVLAAHPEVTEVRTTNAETNANMVDINERLGFKPVALCPGFLRDL
jgi:GNAT superfamily N-acetyltransferase/RimJ/RimL family protein N-acetyltransferase